MKERGLGNVGGAASELDRCRCLTLFLTGVERLRWSTSGFYDARFERRNMAHGADLDRTTHVCTARLSAHPPCTFQPLRVQAVLTAHRQTGSRGERGVDGQRADPPPRRSDDVALG